MKVKLKEEKNWTSTIPFQMLPICIGDFVSDYVYIYILGLASPEILVID